jgi:hypothetical protein
MGACDPSRSGDGTKGGRAAMVDGELMRRKKRRRGRCSHWRCGRRPGLVVGGNRRGRRGAIFHRLERRQEATTVANDDGPNEGCGSGRSRGESERK